MNGIPEGELALRHRLRWMWMPTAALALASLLLALVRPGWGLLGLMATALWVVLAATSFLVKEGVPTGAWRREGIFAAYRRWSGLLSVLALYAGVLLVGGLPFMRKTLDPYDAQYLLCGLLFAAACLPLECCNLWLGWRGDARPSMRRALSLWLPALPVGQLGTWLLLDVLAHHTSDLVRPVHYIAGMAFGLGNLLVLVAMHRAALNWHARVEHANERAATADTARHLAEARLAVLQAQIEPHFLFNTLATVEYLIKSDPDKAAALLSQLTRYLRLAMPSMRQLSSTLGREFELTDAYLQIAQLRMGGRLTVDVDLPDALRIAEFPSLVVQTLVENAIKHGVEPKPGPVRIRVFARRVGGELHVGVQDNGVGLSGITAPDGGTGLQNIRERLRGLHGERAQLSVVGLAEGGVLATVVLPLDAR